jgi:hypothetical protein
MAIKWYTPTSPMRVSPRDEFRGAQQAFIDNAFYNSSSIITIEQETSFGNQEYEDIDVWLESVIVNKTGLKLGDDYKNLIFQNASSNPILGKRYRFFNNIWMTIFTNNYDAYETSVAVIRCNTTMNWYLENGTIHKEPIALGYDFTDTSFIFKTKLDTREGELTAIVQYNDFTSKLVVNDEFIFGHGSSKQKYKLRAVNSTISQETFNDDPKIIKLDFMLYNENLSEDNITDRASEPIPNYTIEINESPFEQIVGYTTQLTATVKDNDVIVSDIPIEWSTSDGSVISVDANGNIQLLQLGNATITANIVGNNTINDNISIDVVASPIDNFEVRINPDENIVRQGNTQQYSVYLYNNDVQQVDTFTISEIGGLVPTDNYSLNIIDGNTFEIINIEQFDDGDLTIECVSGIHSAQIDIQLGGLW